MLKPRRFLSVDTTLHLVLDPELCEHSGGLVETALAAVAGGAGILQLRAPNMKKRAMVEAARALMKALASTGVPLIIDDHADVMLAANADGLHIGQKDLTAKDARQLIGMEKILGLSASSLAELLSAPLELIDYYGVGPVFPTSSKADAGAAVGLEKLAEIVPAAQKPCVAIGGIHSINVADVARTGVAGVAVISAVCGQADVRVAATELIAAFRQGH